MSLIKCLEKTHNFGRSSIAAIKVLEKITITRWLVGWLYVNWRIWGKNMPSPRFYQNNFIICLLKENWNGDIWADSVKAGKLSLNSAKYL